MSYDNNTPILGTGTVSAEAINAYFADRGPDYAKTFAPDKTYKPAPPTLGQDIIAVSRQWGINADVMAAQIMHESAGWQSRIVRDKNNPSGLGAVDNNAYAGAVTFSTPFEGVRATAAHLMTYAVGHGAWTVYDPRASNVPVGNVGTCKTWGSLGGKWATDTGYGGRVATLANRLVTFANDGSWGPPMAAQIPGFTWSPADDDHHDKGRDGVKIIGGAQHYSAGTNSLAWLTTTSGRNPHNPDAMVSAHFLIKTNPTMADRGWQLVRIEDTAWTTGGIVNPKTVAIEKEHLAGGLLDDIDYDVMAQTWLDIAAYVKGHNLGEIPITRTGIRGHKEWVNQPDRVCPDGISVDRIVARAVALATPVVDPNAQHFPETDKWVVNQPGAPMLTLWRDRGGVAVCGYPLLGMTLDGDGVYRQLFENVFLECWPDGRRRFGGLGQRYMAALARIAELEAA